MGVGCCVSPQSSTNVRCHPKSGRTHQGVGANGRLLAKSVEGREGDSEDIEDEDDTEMTEENPYGGRSLAWTKRYRKLITYERARQRAMSLGLRSKEEWDEYIEDGKMEHGPYLPTRPDEMYPEDFDSWEEFLGCIRPYDETCQIVQSVLGLKSMNDYRNFVLADTKRAEGLRIPAKPDIVYKESGWIDEDHFFNGTNTTSK